MTLKNILLVGPKETVGQIVSSTDLPCKVLVIEDGFKALVGLLKLVLSERPLDGIYIHGETSRVELPGYVQSIRAIETGLGKSPLPICLAVNEGMMPPMDDDIVDLAVVPLPDGDSLETRLASLTSQLAAFAAGGER